MKKGIVALALAATLVIALVGMAVAVSQTWYLTDVSTVVPGADHTMIKGGGAGSAHVIVGTTPIVWNSDEAAVVDVGFGTEPWPITMRFTNAGAGGWLESVETMTLEIGTLSGGAFTPALRRTMSGPAAGFSMHLFPLVPGAPFAVRAGDYLAYRLVVDTGFVHVDVSPAPSPSWVRSPVEDPGYPVFELPTLLLMSGGLLALVGYVVYDRRRRRRRLSMA